MKKTPEDIIILHMCTITYDHMMYGSWDIKHDRQNFLSFWAVFCPFTPITQKIKILKNWKKTPGDIIILHKCTKNNDHMLYGSWDMARSRCVTFHFGLFLPFYLPNSPKIQNLKKMKKDAWRYHQLYNSVPKIMIICYTVPEIWHMTDVIIFYFGPFFAQKIKH